MKQKIYITISLLGLGALLGTAGGSDFENLSVLSTFIATLVWTSVWIGFGVLALKTSQKRKSPLRSGNSDRGQA